MLSLVVNEKEPKSKTSALFFRWRTDRTRNHRDRGPGA